MSRMFLASILIHATLIGALVILLKSSESPPPAETMRITVEPGKAAASPPEKREFPQATPALAPAEKTVAGSQGTTVEDNSYAAMVRERIRAKTHFPLDLVRRRIQGEAIVALQISTTGTLASVRLSSSSGHAELDEIAQQAVRDAFPLPPPPTGKTPLSLTLPIDFQAR